VSGGAWEVAAIADLEAKSLDTPTRESDWLKMRIEKLLRERRQRHGRESISER
jgi:hypothetical protein